MKKMSFEFKLSVIAIGAIALLCLTLQVYFQDYQKISREIDSFNNIYQRASLLNQIVITSQQAEFSQQSYLLNNTEQELSHYYEASFKLPVLIDKINSAFSDRPSETANLALLTRLINQKHAQLREQVKAFQENGILGTELMKQGATEDITRKIINITNSMLSNESMLLQEEQNLHNIRSQLQIKLYLVGSVVVLAILAICMSLIIKEVRENRKLAQQLEHNATHDFLTGLPNRSFFVQSLKHTLSRAKRENTLAALFFLDLNGFKAINDTYGHEIGDLVLIRVAEKLRSTMRDSDVLSRLGGDEFVILAPKINQADEIAIISQKIEAALESLSLPFLKEKNLSTSIGFALIPDDGETAEILLAKADGHMYEHKKASKQTGAPIAAQHTAHNQSIPMEKNDI